ncbi:uncharacterized protein LOC141683297 [Apium graveolens]|uniref:uncharacterized protein LOC141683297 n=1 Tax=Apium graveolens TaxID=4045 RepID=UPI003D7AAD02
MGKRRGSSSVNKLFAWVRKQSIKVKIFLAVTAVISSLVALKLLVKDSNHFFVASEAIHVAGIAVLIFKLATQNNCSGLSLKTQQLTAIFTAVRLYCSFLMEGDIHTVLDFATLVFTAWVIYMITFKFKSTYIAELDNMPLYYLVVPCAILSVLIHPYTQHSYVSRILWAFCVYLESISVLPQLHMMQNAKMIEPFTAHYVFALGIARFLGCAHWILSVYDTAGTYLYLLGSGYFWLPMVLLSEIVQTFILADFCYYYVKSVVNGQLLVSLPPV